MARMRSIHVFAETRTARHGSRACAHDDDEGTVLRQPVRPFPSGAALSPDPIEPTGSPIFPVARFRQVRH